MGFMLCNRRVMFTKAYHWLVDYIYAGDCSNRGRSIVVREEAAAIVKRQSVDCSLREGGCNSSETAGDKLREGNYTTIVKRWPVISCEKATILQFIKHGCSPWESNYTEIVSVESCVKLTVTRKQLGWKRARSRCNKWCDATQFEQCQKRLA